MQKPVISFSHLRHFKCLHCEKIITCGPVYLLNDSSSICGRCRMLAKDHYRNECFEGLASVFRYPCTNWQNHCSVMLQWNESLSHEPECSYDSGCCNIFCSHPGSFFKGKRDYPNEDCRLTILPDYILQYITCVLCDSYLNCGPVFTQVNGKSICHRCVNSNGIPPNCRRNLPYEAFALAFVFPCINKIKGCVERSEFGIRLWQHESECQYNLQKIKNYQEDDETGDNNNQPKYEKNGHGGNVPKEKIRGVIKTPRGHIIATITPNSQILFAPPDDPNNDINKVMLKSAKAKKQQRDIRRADQITDDFRRGRRDSDTDSAFSKESHSTNNSVFQASETSIDFTRQVSIPTEDYQSDNFSRSSSFSNRPSSREPFETRIIPPDGYLPPIHGEQETQLGRRTSTRESFKGNSLLISELKARQNMIKKTHSIKGRTDLDQNNPYRQCTNLEELVSVHRKI